MFSYRTISSLSGHSIVAGTIPAGTLLYHSEFSNQVPRKPDWTAIDPEHSLLFCADKEKDNSGCWLLTLVVTKPLRILYFDGNSAGKMLGGSMDSQDLVSWGNIQTSRYFDEDNRIIDLCEWAKDRDVHGFVR